MCYTLVAVKRMTCVEAERGAPLRGGGRTRDGKSTFSPRWPPGWVVRMSNSTDSTGAPAGKPCSRTLRARSGAGDDGAALGRRRQPQRRPRGYSGAAPPMVWLNFRALDGVLPGPSPHPGRGLLRTRLSHATVNRCGWRSAPGIRSALVMDHLQATAANTPACARIRGSRIALGGGGEPGRGGGDREVGKPCSYSRSSERSTPFRQSEICLPAAQQLEIGHRRGRLALIPRRRVAAIRLPPNRDRWHCALEQLTPGWPGSCCS